MTDKMSGYWMFVEKVVKPRLEAELGHSVTGKELGEKGSSLWEVSLL